ncbi:MAG TPA: ATP-binding protein [Longimicrobiales bacterium]
MKVAAGRRDVVLCCGAASACGLLAIAWCRIPDARFLYAGGALLVISALWAGRRRLGAVLRLSAASGDAPVLRQPALIAAYVVLLLALAIGLRTDHRLGRLASGWDGLVAGREADLSRALERSMALVLDRARRAAREAAERASGPPSPGLSSELAAIRARSGVAALAVYDSAGSLVAWAGDHRGPLPPEVRRGAPGVVYAERPLFGYLYVLDAVEGKGGRAVAAVLLQTGLALESEGAIGIGDHFARRTGARPFFAPGPGPRAAWALVEDGDTLVHARFDPITQAAWRADVWNGGRRIVLPLIAAALLLVVVAWRREARSDGASGAAPLLAAGLALAIAPVGAAFGAAERLFSPALFLLPIPLEVSLGRLLVVLLPLGALAAVARPPALDRRAGGAAILVGMVAVALGYAGGLRLMVAGAGPGLLDGGGYLWGPFQFTAVLLLTMLTALALPQGGGGRLRPGLLLGGVSLSLALAAAVLVRWRVWQAIDVWLPALWLLPFGLVALGVMPYSGRGSRIARWLIAGWLATSAVLPRLWVTEVEAKLRSAERELATLGLNPDPFLDYLLHQFAAELIRRDARGEGGVELLYRAWVSSGLAREAYPARITLWQPGADREIELVLGEAVGAGEGGRAARLPPRILDRARSSGEPVLEPAAGPAGAGQTLAVPLSGDRSVSIVVPPRRSLNRATVLAPILGAEPSPDTRLFLIPTLSDQPSWAGVRWLPTEQGWRGEALLHYPDGAYHGHLELRLPSLGVRLARAALLLSAGLALLTVLWALGRAVQGEPPAPPGGWRALAGSFRARVTVALFIFFLLPTILFGMVAYRALAGEAARTARVVANRAVESAAAAYEETAGDLHALAERVGEEVLYYHRGELVRGSSPEVVELGLFGAWLPPDVFATLRSGEETGVVETRRLGDRPYVVAYRRLPEGTLAVPVSLVTGDSALRQRELAHLVLFGALVGGILSLCLSVAVGRTLARPIGQLRRASAAVGSGRLRVRLPESGAGEFGELFASFNRMVRRLRRARAQELRTARVLAWGEMSRQVAHEIKNPLTPIKLAVQHLRRAYADGRRDFDTILETNVDQILTEIDRLTQIARAFSRYGAPAEATGPLGAVDVAVVVGEALMLYRAGEGGVRFHLRLEAELPPVRARAGELKEVLLNLLENAYAALDGEGNITVEARRMGGFVDLGVVDDGPGIAPEQLSKIFDPQFSTRSAGTGLGLAIVRRLVESWDGELSAESEPGRGTAIRMRLRVADRTTAPSGS